MSRGVRAAAITAGVVLVLVVIAGGLFTWFTRRAFPVTTGTLQVEGLKAPVEVYRDEYGVAHIYASSPEDLFFAQGYVHAQERFWQMEFERRVGSGRLSEIFGSGTLETDTYLRTFGFRALAEEAYAGFDPDTKLVLESYADGVNAYVSGRQPAQLGLEFALLDLQGVRWEIEPWTPVDSLVWGYMMVYDQSDKLRTELRNADLLLAAGEQGYAEIVPPYRDDRPTIVQDDGLAALGLPPIGASTALGISELAYLREVNQAMSASPALAQLTTFGFGGVGASNSFVIAGQHTETGSPILANDPHMSQQMPSLWYEVGMHCIEKTDTCPYEFRGNSLPGVPGILIGHNDRIAWGLTNANFDAQDVYIERINPQNPNQYEVNGEWVDMETRVEEIIVHGQDDPVLLTVRSTRHGPVATDTLVEGRTGFSYDEDGNPQLYALSVQWTANAPIRTVEAVMKLIKAQDFEDFRAALERFDAGTQNFIYADVDGNIGFQMPGRVPVRAQGNGAFPVPGWTDDYEWTGFIPYDQMPRAYNPAPGYIVTANNAAVRPDLYPYVLNSEFDRGQRASRITGMVEALLAEDGAISLEEARAIQRDNTSLPALELIPYLNELDYGDPALNAARDRLAGWDGQLLMDSPEAALYNLVWRALLDETFHDQLPEARWPEGKDRDADVVHTLLSQPDSQWWDDRGTAAVETRDDILRLAFEKGYAAGVEAMGEDVDQWTWGDLHTITFRNATLGNSGIGLIESIFNRGPLPVSGGESVPQKTCFNARESYDTTCIPALRQIIDLGDLTGSITTQSVGQSGHPFNRHYDDFIDAWRFFEYHPTNWSREMVEASAKEKLILEPAP